MTAQALALATRPKVIERYEAVSKQVLSKTKGDPAKVPAAAESLGISVGKAQRMLLFAQVPEKDRLYNQDLEGSQLAKRVVDLYDKNGNGWWDIWAGTLTTIDNAHALYVAGGGTQWDRRNGTAKPKAAKSTKASKKAPSKAPAKKTAARAPRRAARRAVKGGGSRAKRAGLVQELHDPATSDDRIFEILEGRMIQVSISLDGMEHTVDQEHGVLKMKSVKVSPSAGRFVNFTDDDHRLRSIALTDIVGIRR